MIEFNVEVLLRRGLGPEWVRKFYPVGFDDLPEELSEIELRKMAINEIESRFYKSEDYQWYGKNWKIIEVHKS